MRWGFSALVGLACVAFVASGCDTMRKLNKASQLNSKDEARAVEEFRGVDPEFTIQPPKQPSEQPSEQAADQTAIQTGDPQATGSQSDDTKPKEASAEGTTEPTTAPVALMNNNARYRQIMAAASDCQAMDNKLPDYKVTGINANPSECLQIYESYRSAGLLLSDDLCRFYFHQVDDLMADVRTAKDSLNYGNTAAAAIMGLASVASPIIGGVGAVVGLAESMVDTTVTNYVFSPDAMGVYALILSKQRAFLDQSSEPDPKTTGRTRLKPVASFYEARRFLQYYNDICAPGRIRDAINQAVSKTADGELSIRVVKKVDLDGLEEGSLFREKLRALFNKDAIINNDAVFQLWLYMVHGVDGTAYAQADLSRSLHDKRILVSNETLNLRDSDDAPKVDEIVSRLGLMLEYADRVKRSPVASANVTEEAIETEAENLVLKEVGADVADASIRKQITLAVFGTLAASDALKAPDRQLLESFLNGWGVTKHNERKATILSDLRTLLGAPTLTRKWTDQAVKLVVTLKPPAEASRLTDYVDADKKAIEAVATQYKAQKGGDGVKVQRALAAFAIAVDGSGFTKDEKAPLQAFLKGSGVANPQDHEAEVKQALADLSGATEDIKRRKDAWIAGARVLLDLLGDVAPAPAAAPAAVVPEAIPLPSAPQPAPGSGTDPMTDQMFRW